MIAMKVSGMAELTRRLETIRREVTSHILPEAGHAALAPVLGTMRQCADRGAKQRTLAERRHRDTPGRCRMERGDVARRPQ